MIIEKKTRVIPIRTYEVYGKKFESETKANEWKKEVEKKLYSAMFIVELNPDNKGNFTKKVLFEVRDNLGRSGLIAKLEKDKVELVNYKTRPATKNVEITRIDRFESWTELNQFLNTVKVDQHIIITEGMLK